MQAAGQYRQSQGHANENCKTVFHFLYLCRQHFLYPRSAPLFLSPCCSASLRWIFTFLDFNILYCTSLQTIKCKVVSCTCFAKRASSSDSLSPHKAPLEPLYFSPTPLSTTAASAAHVKRTMQKTKLRS